MPVDSAQAQPQPDKELVSFIRSRVEESRSSSSRISHEGVWMTNIAYLLGFYGVYFDTTLRQYQPTQNSNTSYLKRSRITANKILPTVQNRLARLCKNPPKYDVRPNSNDTDDKEAARLSLEILNHIMDKQHANQKRLNLYMWMQECGHSYVKVVWDTQLGEPMVDPEDGQIAEFEGDVRLEVLPAFEVFPDPTAKTVDDCQWICHAKLRKLDYFKTHYPERGSLVKEEGAWLLSTQYEQRINSLNVRGQGNTGAQAYAKNCAIELCYYEKRTLKHPNGRMIVVANGVLLEDKELPVGEIPIVKFDDVLIGGKYYSESIITHLRPLQDQFNRVIAQRAAWTNKLLAGKYLAPKGHGIIQEAFTDQSGEIVEYNPGPQGQKPEALQVPVIPQYAYLEDEKLQSMIFDISGINEVSRGQIPSAGIPAIGMQFLMEQDDTRIGIVTEHNENSWAKVGSLVLKHVEQFYQTERVLKIAGPNLEYTVRNFVGQDINGHSDVIVIRGSTLPGSKVLRRQEILNLRSQGLLGNPNDPQVIQKVMEMLEYGDIHQAWEDLSVDLAQIKRDIEMIEKGELPTISEFDNQTLHLQKKNLYRKSDKFKKLSPQSVALLELDIERRIQMLMNMANPGLQQQQQTAQKMQQQLAQAKMMSMAQTQGLNVNQPNISGPPLMPPPGAAPMGGPQPLAPQGPQNEPAA
jgi:hypothetical protein